MEDEVLDIIFISSYESNADENWLMLKKRFPRAKRVHGAKGILQAHRLASEKSKTHHFFVVDGDNVIRPNFHFLAPSVLHSDTLYVYRCLNPVNSLVYGYGAIKIYNKSLLSTSAPKNFKDLATQVANRYQIIEEVASETHFFSTPLEAWRGAFRECVKLQWQIMDNQWAEQAMSRLNQWVHPVRSNGVHLSYCVEGAKQGRNFALQNLENEQSRDFINNFEQLNQFFYSSFGKEQSLGSI